MGLQMEEGVSEVVTEMGLMEKDSFLDKFGETGTGPFPKHILTTN